MAGHCTPAARRRQKRPGCLTTTGAPLLVQEGPEAARTHYVRRTLAARSAGRRPSVTKTTITIIEITIIETRTSRSSRSRSIETRTSRSSRSRSIEIMIIGWGPDRRNAPGIALRASVVVVQSRPSV
jgi:hypothetical protein